MSSRRQNNIKEAFDYLYASAPAASTVVEQRMLSIEHFEALAKATGLSLEDLSIYVLAFYFNAMEGKTRYCISESSFVQHMSNIWPSSGRCDANNHFAPAFNALKKAVQDTNEKFCSDKKELAKFNRFIYEWCIRVGEVYSNNKAARAEQLEISTEIWKLFYHTGDSTVHTIKTFTGYAQFPRLGDWLDYVQSSGFEDTISLDVWQQLIPFAAIVDYDRYDPEDSWPVAMDNFVSWQRKRQTEHVM